MMECELLSLHDSDSSNLSDAFLASADGSIENNVTDLYLAAGSTLLVVGC